MSKAPVPNTPPLTVAHVIDGGKRYPGEPVTLYARIEALAALPGMVVSLSVPAGLDPSGYSAPPGPDGTPWVVPLEDGANTYRWEVHREVPAGSRWDYAVTARVVPTEQDLLLRTRVLVTATCPEGEEQIVTARSAIAVSARGRYLQLLPALYAEDELMGRFLMLFESFVAPIEQIIDLLPYYFDPRIAPVDMLPWLASWVGLVLDERLPEKRRRRLLLAAARLFRQRGTRQGLTEYLEICTEGRARIVEHRSSNLHLSGTARLGPGIALGRGNVPHTFTVTLRLPPASTSVDAAERERREAERRHLIEGILSAEKPAHTRYTLHIETV